MLLPRSTQRPGGAKDGKLNLLADSTRARLWDFGPTFG